MNRKKNIWAKARVIMMKEMPVVRRQRAQMTRASAAGIMMAMGQANQAWVTQGGRSPAAAWVERITAV